MRVFRGFACLESSRNRIIPCIFPDDQGIRKQRRVRRLNQQPGHAKLSARVGIDSGAVVNDKAVEYLGRAGQQALQRFAHSDAVASLSAAIDLLRKLPDTPDRIQRELPLQLALGRAFIVLRGWAAPEVERAFSRALEICEGMGDPPDLFFALHGLYTMYHVRGAFFAARERAQQLLARAQRANDPTLLVLAHSAIGQTSLHTGELLLAIKHLELMLSPYNGDRDRTLVLLMGSDVKQGALSYTGWTLWLLGHPDQAVEKARQAMAAAQASAHPNSIAGAEMFATIVRIYRREPRLVQEMAERVIALSLQHGLGAWLLISPNHRGWAIAQQGRYEEGIGQMKPAQAVAHAAGVDIGRANFLCQLAEGYMKVDRLDEALNASSPRVSRSVNSCASFSDLTSDTMRFIANC